MNDALLALLQTLFALLFFASGLPALVAELGISAEIRAISHRRMSLAPVALLSFTIILCLGYALLRAGDADDELSKDKVVGKLAIVTFLLLMATIIWLHYYFRRVTVLGWARVLRDKLETRIAWKLPIDPSLIEDLVRVSEYSAPGAQKQAVLSECGILLKRAVAGGYRVSEFKPLVSGLVSSIASTEGHEGSPQNGHKVVGLLEEIQVSLSGESELEKTLSLALADLGRWAVDRGLRVLALKVIDAGRHWPRVVFATSRAAIDNDWIVVMAGVSKLMSEFINGQGEQTRYYLVAIIALIEMNGTIPHSVTSSMWQREIGEDFGAACRDLRETAIESGDFNIVKALDYVSSSSFSEREGLS